MVSVAGRRELVRSVITSQLVYLMTVIKPPKKFIKEIDKLRRRFLWARDGDLTGGKCKVAWPRVCQPTENGDLGIKDLELFSRSLKGSDGCGLPGIAGNGHGKICTFLLTVKTCSS